jgi:hypothetical protein
MREAKPVVQNLHLDILNKVGGWRQLSAEEKANIDP